MNRRAILRASALVPVTAALAACGIFTSTTTNDVTTVTVNVSDLNAWGTAIINAATLVSGLPGISTTTQGAGIAAISKAATAALAAVDVAAGTSQTFTFNSGSVPASITSLLSDGTTLLADAQAAAGGVTGTSVQTAQTYIEALTTIVALFQAAVSTIPTTTAPAAASGHVMTVLPDGVIPMPAKMTEAQALAALGVHTN
jgi:hypothetical protein